jgi:hypothetical protein
LEISEYNTKHTSLHGLHHGRLETIASHQVLAVLHAACASIGSACLGFELHKMGTHSLQSRAAMEMYLTGVPVYTIMIIGRWSSKAFLGYICKQIKQFSKGGLKQMITFCSFQTIPDIALHVGSIKDPRQCNHCNNTKTWNNIGRDRSCRVQLPAFSLFN